MASKDNGRTSTANDDELAGWHISRHDQTWGPIAEWELPQAIVRGELRSDDLVWRAGMQGWIRAADVPGLLRPPPAPTGRRAISQTASQRHGAIPAGRREDVTKQQPLSRRVFEIIWPNTKTQNGCQRGIVQGCISFAWIALGHLMDVFLLYAVTNNLRITLAKRPPLDFADFISGNTLAQISVICFVTAIASLAICATTKFRILFAIAPIWAFLQSAMVLLFYWWSMVAWVAATAKILLALNGVRGAWGLQVLRRPKPTAFLKSEQGTA